MTKYVEANVGQERGPGEPQSEKSCEECLYFDRDLCSNPCWDCFVSADKFEWIECDEDARPGQMESSDYRVCEACTE